VWGDLGALPQYLFGHWAIATIALMESTRMVSMVTGRFASSSANDGDDPAYSGAKCLGSEMSRGELTKGRNIHKSSQ